jgi:hypothetical protein
MTWLTRIINSRLSTDAIRIVRVTAAVAALRREVSSTRATTVFARPWTGLYAT